ncbi:MAG: hypothetical protein GY828_03535 [Candidatus Gracilibacteria bacterium]|nr:hypothetical protein [Candidatus Gracilibacteria bacterium]
MKKLYIALGIFILLILTAVMLTKTSLNGYQLEAKNASVQSSLHWLSKTAVNNYQRTGDFGSEGFQLNGHPFNQTFRFNTTTNDERFFQLLGFTCTGDKGKIKKAHIKGFYIPRQAKKYNLVPLPNRIYFDEEDKDLINGNNVVYTEEKGHYEFKVGDITNLGTVIAVNEGGVILDKQVEKHNTFITLLKDTPITLFKDTNGNVIEHNQVIGSCGENEFKSLN